MRRSAFLSALLLSFVLFAGMPVMAQDAHHDMSLVQSPTDDNAKAMADMHAAMDKPTTGDADADFVRGMIPHHQGAVDMAKAVVKNGKDPEVRAFAKRIEQAQTEEIAWMRQWLKDHKIPEDGAYTVKK